ncbi:hypothetical protein V6N13_026252 [Hibiscus sabdariffa]
MNPYQNPSGEELPTGNGMAVGFTGGRPPDDVVVVEGLNVLERSGSPVPQAVQPLQKRGRGLEESMLIDNEPVTKETEVRVLDGGGQQGKDAQGGTSKSPIPSFKDKLVGDKGVSCNGRLLTELDADGALDSVVARSFKLLRWSKMPDIVAVFEPPTVADMVSENGDWDWDRLREVLPVAILDHLAATPPPLSHLGEDVPGWRWDDKREFRVSSAYTVLMQAGEREVADSLSSLSFEEWLHGNISGRLPAIISRKDWGMEFAIYCWLLWKLRCSMVLDPSFVERESVWERGRRLLVECQAVFAAAVRDPAALSISAKRWIGPQRGWIKGNVDAAVSIGDGSCNGVADKLAKHGQKASLQGLLFAVPPGPVALVVVAEQQYWEAGKSFDNPRV